MPFRLTNTPTIFQALINDLFQSWLLLFSYTLMTFSYFLSQKSNMWSTSIRCWRGCSSSSCSSRQRRTSSIRRQCLLVRLGWIQKRLIWWLIGLFPQIGGLSKPFTMDMLMYCGKCTASLQTVAGVAVFSHVAQGSLFPQHFDLYSALNLYLYFLSLSTYSVHEFLILMTFRWTTQRFMTFNSL